MGEILSIIRLKDKVTITVLMSILALIVTGGVGVASYATRHQHSYEYHLEKGEDGQFDLVGYCNGDDCDMPIYPRDIESGEVQTIASESKAPTCCEIGKTVYGFTYGGVTYTYEEDIPVIDHVYQVNGKIDGATVVGNCTNEGCTSPELNVEQAQISDKELYEVTAATCNSPRIEKYTCIVNGEKKILVSIIQENIPHTVGGVPVTDHLIKIPFVNTEFYKYGAPGIVAVPIDGVSICDTEINGYYICEKCGVTKHILVYKENHTYELSVDETDDPTLDSKGIAHIRCVEKYCTGHVPVTLPPIVIGENAEVIKQIQDTESQIVKYTYKYEEYGIVIEREIEIPWVQHDFDLIADHIEYPSFDTEGRVVLKCKNSVCSEERVVILPKLEVGVNTTITKDHILEKETVSYFYENTEYGFEIKYDYDNEWIDHTYAYVEDDTINPTLDSDGKAYARCTYEGCDKFHEITIPKINVGKNTTLVSKATEQSPRIERYTYEYKSKDYGYNFTITFEFKYGEALSHNYKYHLDIMGLGVVELVGVCKQDGCQQPETREVVPAVMSEIAPDCTNMGYLIFTFERDGKVYEESMPYPALGHKYEVTSVVNPTENEQGSAVVKCTRDGCGETHEFSLPKILIGEGGNSKEIALDEDSETKTVEYNYTNKSYSVSVKLELTLSHPVHKYAILVGKTEKPGLDSVGSITVACQNTHCTENHKEYTVEIPKILIGEGGNAEEIDFDQDTETKTVLYIYEIEEYGVRATIELTLPHPKHKYAIVADKTVNPGLDSVGSITVACQNTHCTENHKEYTVEIPKILIGEGGNTVQTDSNLDEETKTVKYTYKINDYGVTAVIELILPNPVHRYQINEAETEKPSFESEGKAYLYCQNSGCQDSTKKIEVVLPALKVGENTTILYDHIAETETVIYVYESIDYGFIVTFSYDNEWIDHTYVYSANETVKPTLDTDGVAYVRCSYEGCEKFHEITIPKIVKSEHKVEEATEQHARIIKYKYVCEEYSFTVEFDYYDGSPLVHEYTYELVYNENTGMFDFIGVCGQPGCQKPEEIEEGVDAISFVVDATCDTPKRVIASYEKNGIDYTIETEVGEPLGHEYYDYMTNLGAYECVDPTYDSEGYINVYCIREGCDHTAHIVLPKIEMGVTAFEAVAGDGLYYLYKDEESGYEHFFFIVY